MSKNGTFKSEDVALSYDRFLVAVTKLIDKGYIKKRNDTYRLTELGRQSAKSLSEVDSKLKN